MADYQHAADNAHSGCVKHEKQPAVWACVRSDCRMGFQLTGNQCFVTALEMGEFGMKILNQSEKNNQNLQPGISMHFTWS